MVETPHKSPRLIKELEFYIQHQAELVEKYANRYLVIVGEKVMGDYATRHEAYWASREKFPLGTFLIQWCMPGEDNYSRTFHHHVKV
jgi:hypothetical protein